MCGELSLEVTAVPLVADSAEASSHLDCRRHLFRHGKVACFTLVDTHEAKHTKAEAESSEVIGQIFGHHKAQANKYKLLLRENLAIL